MAAIPPAPVARRSPRPRLLSTASGEVRTPVVLGLAALGLAVLALGTFGTLVVAGAGRPETLAVWAVAALLVVKAPLLGVVWWILVRRRDPTGGGDWSSDECAEILAYLERQAGEATGRPDAAERLAYFSREAWFVADAASDADKAAAVATAVRIEAMAGHVGGGAVTRSEGAGPG